MDSVYNSTTISFEPSSTDRRRPWTLSEIVSPPPTRSKAIHYILLGGSVFLVALGLLTIIIAISNTPGSNDETEKSEGSESGVGPWLFVLLGVLLLVTGTFLLYATCRGDNFTKCFPRGRSILRNAKPRLHSNGGSNLLGNDGAQSITTNFDPVNDVQGFLSSDHRDSISEEKAKLMTHEAKEGIDEPCDHLASSDQHAPSSGSAKDPRIVLQVA